MTKRLTIDPAEFGDASNVLLVAPEVREPMEDVFARLLESLEAAPGRVLGVTTAKPPEDFLNPWRRALEDDPVSFSFVSTAGVARSAAGAEPGGDRRSTPGADVVRLPEPRPLPVLYRSIAEDLEGADGETVVCFHSLTHLLEYVDVETAFRFLHVLLERVRDAGARGFFHIDGDIHEETTVLELTTLFDAVAEFDRDRPAYETSRADTGGR